MADQVTATFLEALSRSEQAELLENMPPDSVTLQPVKLRPGEHGDMATALVIVALTMTTITGICAWVSTRKKAAKFRIKLAAVGVSSDFELEITDSHTPERVRRELREKGVEVR